MSEVITPTRQATSTKQALTVGQIREILKAQNAANNAIDAFNKYIEQKNYPDDHKLTAEEQNEIKTTLKNADFDYEQAIRQNVAEVAPPPVVEQKKPTRAFSEKVFRKDTPDYILEKAKNGELTKDEAIIWATTTTKEGRKLLGISGRLDASERAILIKQEKERKKIEKENQTETPPSPENKENFFKKTGRGLVNVFTWPVRGLLSLFGAKKLSENLKWKSSDTSKQNNMQGEKTEQAEPDTSTRSIHKHSGKISSETSATEETSASQKNKNDVKLVPIDPPLEETQPSLVEKRSLTPDTKEPSKYPKDNNAPNLVPMNPPPEESK